MMQRFFLKSLLIAVGVCSVLGIASGCYLPFRFVGNTPIITEPPNGTVVGAGAGAQFIFAHNNTNGEYTCFVSNQETCPKITQEQNCDQLQNVAFNGLDTGVLYRVGCTCRFQGVVRTITRSFSIPAQPFDCNAYLINDGISYFNYTVAGDATTCFMWDSTGNPSGFRCSIDSGTPFTCESPLYRELSVAQHTIKISPQSCPGDATFLFRKFDVPMEGSATSLSVD